MEWTIYIEWTLDIFRVFKTQTLKLYIWFSRITLLSYIFTQVNMDFIVDVIYARVDIVATGNLFVHLCGTVSLYSIYILILQGQLCVDFIYLTHSLSKTVSENKTN